MYYYEVAIASNRYHDSKPLVFHSKDELEVGCVVLASLRGRPVLGLVLDRTRPPEFKTVPINKIITKTPIPTQLIRLVDWMVGYYPTRQSLVLGSILPNFLSRYASFDVASKRSLNTSSEAKPLALNDDQKTVLKDVISSKSTSFLLHGDTASGKTRVYVELARHFLRLNKSVLVLTPEIGLTPQLENTFRQAFGRGVVVFHSTLTDKERADIWFRVLNSTEPLVVIGPRSALFLPLGSLGAIVMDEAHDGAYKQDRSPHYLTSRVAAALANLHGAKFIMGSATPSITDYYTFKKKGLPILRLEKAAVGKRIYRADIIAIQQRDNFVRNQNLSEALLNGVARALSAGEQSIVFLNRRGTARLTLCSNCGWHATCPKCDISLTYHGDSHQLRCHTCGYHDAPAVSCPVCRGQDLLLKNLGTKQIESDLGKLFPSAKLARFDTDIPKSESMSSSYEKIASGEIDILIGTQILTKGLDLPNLTFIGVVLADSGLYMPDYTSEEQTFQQLTQVLGRVGRGHKRGEIVIQTYNAKSPVLKHVISRDYLSFYKEQLPHRKKYNYPPFCYLLKIHYSSKRSAYAEQVCLRLADKIKKMHLPLEIVGPSPAFYKKVNGMYRWQVVVKARNRQHLTQIISVLDPKFRYDIDPINLL